MRDRGSGKNGLIDEFQLFDRELSAFEVSMLAGTDLESSDEFEAFLRTAYLMIPLSLFSILKSLSEKEKKWVTPGGEFPKSW